MARTKRPWARTTSDERRTLATYATRDLGARIVEIGESMQLTDDRMQRERERDVPRGASLEAHHLAQTRADLLAIAAELASRIDALMAEAS